MALSLILFIVLLMIWLGFASVGHEVWIHRYYVNVLMFIFEYGRKRVEKVREKKQKIQRRLSRIHDLYNEDQEIIKNNNDKDDESEDEYFDDDYRDDEIDDSNIETSRFQLDLSSSNGIKKEFSVGDVFYFVRVGVQSIVDDQVTKRFKAEELKTWNLLTRTDKFYHYNSLRLAIIWSTGFLVRYLFLFPFRFIITFLGINWFVICTYLISCIPEGPLKRWIYYHASIFCFKILSRGFSGIINFHNIENKAKAGGICVANHTSPIDVVVLHCDNTYALVGQRQGGLLGVIQRALSRASHHIWFERFETKDRTRVAERLSDHANDPNKLPILIFPEGTCINNSCVMQFKKGSFEVGGTIYPVAIKYDSRFGDPFWDSSKYGYMRYLLMMMTSWAIVCDVWYLPPMTRRQDEPSIDFAERVKAAIAMKGGLVDLNWDGQLKRQQVKPEWKANQQFKFSQMIKVNGFDEENKIK